MPRAWLLSAVVGICLVSLTWINSSPLWADDSTKPGDAQKPAETQKLDPAVPAALQAGHSLHGETFNEGPRQKAYLMGSTGPVHLEITAKDPLVQKFFDQGWGQVHGFWYFEAERSFRQAAAIDPECAMSYFGMAMANVNNETRAQGFIKKALALKAKASRREGLWIDAYSAYFNNKDRKARTTTLIGKLEEIIYEFPAELEAKAFLAYTLWGGTSSVPGGSYVALDALIGEVLAVEPLHPVHHYRIHLWDPKKAERALASSALCGQGSPGIAHMWHMPGHIYWKVQRYADSAWQQEASARVDHANMIHDHVMPYQIHNYAHNNEWLTRSLSHVGRVHDAIELAKNLIELPRHPQQNHLKNRGGAAYFGRTRLYETLLRYELWDEAIALADTMYLEATDLPEEQTRRLRLLGVAYFSKGDAEHGKQQIAALEANRDALKAEQLKAGQDAETKARNEKLADDKIAKAKTDAEKNFAGKITPVETAIAELTGRLALLNGDTKLALAQFEQVKDLSNEQQSRVQLAAGNKDKAEQLARQAVSSAKNQVQPVANLADVLYGCGKTKEACDTFKQLREMSAYLDADLPIVKRLAPIAQELSLSSDWRVPASIAADTGKRPELDSLGPFRWHPTPAASWELVGTNGSPLTLKQFEGRPVVLVFYLGHGCLHCVEQLKKFAPLQPQYADAGISIVAISTDTQDDLKLSLQAFSEQGEFPIPLASDAGLNVFKAYRAHDDFEGTPLHGTYLIDRQGLVRWQDIGHQPFTDAAFLLEESKRLLALPGK